jgi:hypothetical protein
MDVDVRGEGGMFLTGRAQKPEDKRAEVLEVFRKDGETAVGQPGTEQSHRSKVAGGRYPR